MDQNQVAYEKKYTEGYGVTVPESHIVRIYHRILKHDYNVSGGDILDFGMGTGVHLKWFISQGNWSVSGCDISSNAIEKARQLIPDRANHFFVTDTVPELKNIFKEKFDFIFSNQVLYYLNNEELENILCQFNDMLKPGGMIYASMMPRDHFYFDRSEAIPGSDLRKVTLTGRLNETTHINFKNKSEMVKDFSIFEPLHIGHYELFIREDEGKDIHNFFIGRKRP